MVRTIVAMGLALAVALAVGSGCGGAEGAGATTAGERGSNVDPGVDIRPPGRFAVRLVPEDGSLLDVTLYVAPSSGVVTADLPRAAGRDARRLAIRDVECDHEPLTAGANGWTLPPRCNVLHWRVAFARIPDAGYDPRSRTAVRSESPAYWLVPAAAALLVPSSMDERATLDLRPPAGVAAYHALAGTSQENLTLPMPNELGDVVFGLGALHEASTSDGATRIRFVTDTEMEVTGIAPGLALDFLARITRGHAPREVIVFLLGRAVGEPTATVAGSDVIVMSHPEGEPTAEGAHAMSLAFASAWLRVLAGRRVPSWASTSLAAFYAERALHEAGVDAGAEPEPRSPARPPRTRPDGRAGSAAGAPELTLLAAQRSLVDHGDPDAEAHFATIGPGFWDAIDQSIARGSSNEQNLDDVAADLLELVYDEDGTPPQRFLTLLTDAGAADAAEICTAWLGWPTR